MKRSIGCLMVMLCALFSKAQPIEYGVRFDAFFDNREATREFAHAQTLGGSRIAADIGVVLEEYHRIRLGIDGLYEFGTELEEMSANLILYYQYDHGRWETCFGAFPRRDRLNYPVALLNDTIQYYRPNIEGGYVEYRTKNFNQNLWIDWDGARSDDRRESFNAGISGEFKFGNFFIQDYVLMSHLSGTWESPGVIDNGGWIATLGYDFSRGKEGIHARLQSGILGSYYRDRGFMDEMELNHAFYSNLKFDYRWFATDITYKQGPKLDLRYGETYYSNAESYVKTDLIFKLANKKRIRANVILGVQYADGTFDSQQRVLLSYVFSDL